MSVVRVLHVNKLYYPWKGGVEQTVQDIAEGLRDRFNLEVEVLVCQPRGKGRCEIINGVKVTRASSLGIILGMPVSFSFPFLYKKLSDSFDIIHFHMPFPLGTWSWWLFKTQKARIVVHYHSDIIRQKRFAWAYNTFLIRLLKAADLIIVTSPNLLANSSTLRPFHQKCKVVPLPINLQRHQQPTLDKGQALKKKLGLKDTDKVALFVGRLVYYKGVEYLIEAMQYIDAKLIIVGDGPLKGRLQQKAQKMTLANKIFFVGKVSDQELGVYYTIANVFILPSVEPTEAFGVVQLEAMAYGVPVVNTNLPTGVPWVSRHGETGLTVPPRDSKALVEAINTILIDRPLVETFSRNCKYRVKEFAIEKVVDQIYALYKEILQWEVQKT